MENTVQMSAPEATMTLAPANCPICGQVNPPAEVYCVECGLLLAGGAPETEQEPQAVPKLVDGLGQTHLLKAGVNIVGRDPASDILINDPAVSRKHAQITIADDTATIEDLGSANGTKVDDVAVEPEQPVGLANGASVQFGSIVMTLELPEGFVAPEPPPEAPAIAYMASGDQRYALKSGVNSVGRKPGNDIAINDPYVSSQHATIELVGDLARITDLGSANGVYINEGRITPNVATEWPEDAIAKIGQSEYRLEWVEIAEEETSEIDA